MATRKQWIEGLRLRTLPAALAPIPLGVGAAAAVGAINWPRAVLALITALFLQVGCNFANDYSDGVRGTDADRVGPPRLTASGTVRPRTVKAVAFGCFGLAGISGITLIAASGHWWLLIVGVACVAAAWFYTGGKHPYGYVGLGDLGVFLFFGMVATLGTAYTQHAHVTWVAHVAGAGAGLLASAILMANNLRDIPTDTKSGKKTLAVRLGDTGARIAYTIEIALAFALLLVIAYSRPLVLIGLVLILPAIRAVGKTLRGARGMELVSILKLTGLIELGYGLLVAIALAL